MYGFGQRMICVCVFACVCAAERESMIVCMCVKEKNHFMCFEFVLLFSPLQGKYRHQRDQSAGAYSSQRGSQLCKECRMCIKSLHSLLNSHTTIVIVQYSSYVQYSGQMPFYS